MISLFLFILFLFQNIYVTSLPAFGKANTYYHVHFHVHDKDLSKLLSKKLQDLIHRGELFVHFIQDTDRMKLLGFKILFIFGSLVGSYRLWSSYQKYKKIYDELEMIIYDHDEIRQLLQDNPLEEGKGDSFFIFFYLKEIASTTYCYKKVQCTKEQENLVKKIFDIIKKDYRFQQIIFTSPKPICSKALLYKMIYSIISSGYHLA
jgi:hypothetical protein